MSTTETVTTGAGTRPKTLNIILAAIADLDEKNGSSVIAIKQWIQTKYPEIPDNRLKGMMKRSLAKGLEINVLVRPKKSEDLVGMKGRFKLGKPPKPIKAPPKKKVQTVKGGKENKKPRKKASVENGSADESKKSPKKSPKKKSTKTKKVAAAAKPRSASSSPVKPSKSKKNVKLSRRSKSHSPAKKITKKIGKSPASIGKSPAIKKSRSKVKINEKAASNPKSKSSKKNKKADE
ncbi:uncharacterized protein [Antedon mediterranea]|uniref:uncharacterized protein n=1 Tax=Antedon mediterranea TaxID=105859 RepID=UPI003AF6F280